MRTEPPPPAAQPGADPAATRRARRLRVALRLAVLAAVLVALHYGGRWATAEVQAHFIGASRTHGMVALAVVVGVYVVAMALPFVPGIEISLALLMVFGAQGALLVYVATLAALCLAFVAGRLIPPRLIGRLFGWLHFYRARDLLARLAPLAPEERLRVLVEHAPARLLPFLLRHRYLAVAVAFNLPGNALVGGGGGIALAAGLSGLFRFPHYALMVAVAISPIPLAVLAQAHILPSLLPQ